MGLYREHVVPRLVDRACAAARFDRWRARATEGLYGRVIEIGFGSGLNVRHYPSDVEVILAVEPATVAWRMAGRRLAASPIPVSRVGPDGQHIPLEDASCQAALFTFTLCTVPDPGLVLSELRRVVRPGGTVHFVEHGLSPDTGVAKWQHRIEPLRCGLAGGCHLTRDPSALVARAGFVMGRTEQAYAGGPKLSSWLTFGVATNPVV
ncbi:MAG TPA: class I SAM-dependent methyltransferase [Acidimicrobiales bacterium]|jgi:SAM-dependent methyltransferase|nr:class I SAM-dependent methyltransferase [Acidimicrobiales bacterium]